jgi:NTE family protein
MRPWTGSRSSSTVSGCARGLAHIGALDALEEAGLVVDRIGGCSMGALVGGLYACGRSPGEIAAICREELVEGRPMRDYTLPVAGLIRRGRAEAMLRRMFAQRQIEELPLGYYCVSADLVSGELIEHTTGALLQAVGASICLPGISPPVPDGDRLLIDGGILNHLPVERSEATERAIQVRGDDALAGMGLG